mgnify:CR=1 FL=1
MENERIIKAAIDAHIHEDIIQFPNGYETVVGERGVTLSGGQKQRISIARALIRNPELLILDDCLSAVDTSTENRIQNNLKPLLKKSISIVIGHRISSVSSCDCIIVFENGEIAEQGDHRQLLKNKKIYYEIYQKQLIEKNN